MDPCRMVNWLRWLTLLFIGGIASPALDFLLLQDLSFSFSNDLSALREHVPEIFGSLGQIYRGSRFGLASFVDKPLEPFGFADSLDYCFKLHQPLETVDITKLQSILDGLETFSGNDWWENQLGAILHAVRSSAVDWKFEEDNRVPIIAVSTDAGYHEAGDGVKAGLTTANAGGFDDNCLTEDYPSEELVRVALEEKNVKILMLVTRDLKMYYTKKMQKAFGKDRVIVVDIRDDSANIVQAIHEGVELMERNSMMEHTGIRNAHGFGEDLPEDVLQTLLEQEKRNQEDEGTLNVVAEEDLPKLRMQKPHLFSARDIRRSIDSIHEEVSGGPAISRSGAEWDRAVLDRSILFEQRNDAPTSKPTPVITCKYGDNIIFEIVLAQDASDSFKDDMTNVRTKIPESFEAINALFPGSLFGLTAFVDKPIETFGYSSSGDYCASMRVGLTSNVNDVKNSLDNLIIRSGRDWKEAQLHALVHSAYTRKAGWSTGTLDKNGKKIYRVIALATDAGYHEAGDAKTLPPNNGDRSQDCSGEDYPSTDQVRVALQSSNIHPLFLVTEKVRGIYETLLQELKLDGSVVVIDSESANIQAALFQGLENICQSKPMEFKPCSDSSCCNSGCCGNCDNSEVLIRLAQKPKFMSLVVKN